jgi:hypothetical protein
MVFVLAACGDSQQQNQTKLDVSIPTYDIVDRQTYDTPIKTQIELNAVVSGKLTEIGIEQLLRKLYNEANATQGFKYHGGKPTHVFIYLYTSQDVFKSGMGMWVGMLSRIGENSPIETSLKKELISQSMMEPEVKYGYTESLRKEIFMAIVRVEDFADAEAERKYPVPKAKDSGYSQTNISEQMKKYAEVQDTVKNKLRAELAKQYGLTEEQLLKISVEGLEKGWPMP